MLTFLSPLFLLGLFSAAIPLVIHLSRSRRTKTLRFSTTRFFTDQFLRSYRMSKLKELLLLACRMVLCALLATAFARPLLLPKGKSSLVGGGSRAVVLVIDDSASMGYVEDGSTQLDRAKAAARDVVAGLRPGDSASVVLAARRAAGPSVLFPEPTPALGDVVQAIDAVKVASLATDLSAALEKAEEIARASAANGKEVYILSDLQAGAWEAPGAKVGPNGGASDLQLFLVQARPGTSANLAATALQYETARPMVGAPFSIRPHLSIVGDPPPSSEVRLVVDGRKVGERPIEKLRTGRWAVPRFDHVFTSSGWHSGYVEVQDEALPEDNRRYFAFEVLDSIRVLAVDGAPSQVPRLDELFFLKTALTAVPEGKSPIQLDVVGPAPLQDSDLKRYPLVILANVESLAAPTVEAIEGFVDRGGSLLIFLGDRVNPILYNQDLASPTRLHGGLLPGRLLAREGNPAGSADVATVGNVDDQHVVMSAFADPKFADLSAVSFRALWGIDPSGADVLMRANTGSPLLCEKAFGKGRVMLFASGCDRDWTNFPVRPAFLPWVHRLVGYLAQEPQGRRGFHATGDVASIPVSASAGPPRISVKKPDGTIGRAEAGDDPTLPWTFRETEQAGVYTLLSTDKASDSAPAPLFAANLDGQESDLTYLDDVFADRDDSASRSTREAKVEAGFRSLLPGRPALTYLSDPSRVSEVSLGARRGVRLWDLALTAALLIALFEPWLANRISLRHYSRPREATGADVPRVGRWGRVPVVATPALEPSSRGGHEP